jgi:outer membrane protein assembly factor BamE (lipoprotein component of BamABCDE complex)
MLPAAFPSPIMAPPPPAQTVAPGTYPVQGKASLDRFVFYVSLTLVIAFAWSPWSLRPEKDSSPAPDQPARLAAGQRAGAPSHLGVPTAAAGAAASAPKKEYISLGSSEDEVKAVMGPPRDIDANDKRSRWFYGSSYVEFSNGRVVNYHDSLLGELKLPKTQGVARNRPAYLARGLTRDEVRLLQGEPTRRDQTRNRWYYGSSYVDFQDDRVSDYFNGVLKELKVSDRQ